MEYQVLSVTVDPDTRALLRRMQRYTGEPASQLVRWALAFYAASGPWHCGPDADRDADLGSPPALPVGPTYSRRLVP
jgi:hypothetical protein